MSNTDDFKEYRNRLADIDAAILEIMNQVEAVSKMSKPYLDSIALDELTARLSAARVSLAEIITGAAGDE